MYLPKGSSLEYLPQGWRLVFLAGSKPGARDWRTHQEVGEGLEACCEEEGEGEEERHHQHHREQDPGQSEAHLQSSKHTLRTSCVEWRDG